MSVSPRPRLAFLGLGLMGKPMARRLAQAGFELSVWNRTADKCGEIGGNTRIAATAADAAANADMVMLCLVDTRVVERVVFGEAGVAAGIRKGACIVDFSTIDPRWLHQAHRRLAVQAGVAWIDAPVSGGVPGAQAGTLTMFCGGDAQRIDAAHGVLEVLARRITRFGPAGSGLVAKLCNQTIVAAQLAAIAEALKLAESGGLDPRVLVEALKGGWADSTLLQLFGPRFASRTETPRLGEICTMRETLDLARSCAAARGLPVPLADTAAAIYGALAAAGRQGRDLGALMD